MIDHLSSVIEAHGGLDRWRTVRAIDVTMTVHNSLKIRNPCSNVFEWDRRSTVVLDRGKSRVSTRNIPHSAIPSEFGDRKSRGN